MSDPYKRVILVTGSNAGIGLDLVHQLAAQGHIVYLSGRNPTAVKEAQEKLNKEHNLRVKTVQLDVTDIKSIQAAKDAIEKAEGRLDVLVNNAGVGLLSKNQNATTVFVDTFREAYETNVFGLVQTTTTFLPLIRKGRTGYQVILNVASDMASNSLQAGPNARPHFVAYNSSKAAANGYTIALAAELKKEGIKVNAFSPGQTLTKLNNFHEGGRTTEDAARMLVEWALLGPDDKRTGLFYWPEGELAW